MAVQIVWKVVKIDERGQFTSTIVPEPLRMTYQLGEVARSKISGGKLFACRSLNEAVLLAKSWSNLFGACGVLEGQADVSVLDVQFVLPVNAVPTTLAVERAEGFWAWFNEQLRNGSLEVVDFRSEDILAVAADLSTILLDWFKPDKVVWRSN